MSKPETIQFTVRTSDGGYESSLSVPVDSTKEQREGFAKMWVNMMAEAMKMSPKEQP